ncbi:MAG: class I SAM-dependent methyltransferase [Gammaproteobacteria bacterium]|nr:class I SAM-dependent methyltransferase [Gammaproteobacteria bacterium]MCP5137408.1 class I SAM-dependent methyltransferase [Gammaproteobacteria bacterium]
MAFKDHFSGHADAYASARPDYPTSLYAWLAQQTPTRSHAWDCATGNGQAAIGLALHFDQVSASDASADQIANAIPQANVRYLVASAEHSTLHQTSVDLISVAQALHWFDHDAFYAEVRRVARPNGVLAAWTYGLTRVNPAIDAIVDTLYEDLLDPWWPPERRHVETGYQDLAFPFAEIPSPDFAMRQYWSLTQFIAYLHTWSAMQRYLRNHKSRDAIDEIEHRLASVWRHADRVREVLWPLRMRVGRV